MAKRPIGECKVEALNIINASCYIRSLDSEKIIFRAATQDPFQIDLTENFRKAIRGDKPELSLVFGWSTFPRDAQPAALSLVDAWDRRLKAIIQQINEQTTSGQMKQIIFEVNEANGVLEEGLQNLAMDGLISCAQG